MKVVLANITISTGGVLRLSKDLMNQVGIQAGDKIVVMREDDNVTIQFQRNDAVLLRLSDAKIVNP
jgi:formylmethanofuran dehydrogenase subunit D